jgi:carboxylesterase type B
VRPNASACLRPPPLSTRLSLPVRLGWSSHPSLDTNTPTTGVGGNWGLYDNLFALNWVQNNIGYFGGDPTRVTINGESAGATHTMMLLSSPLAYSPTPLFRAAIMQSVWPSGGMGVTYSKAVRDASGDMMVGVLGCDPAGYSFNSMSAPSNLLPSIATCLRAKSAQEIQTMNPSTANITTYDGVYGSLAWEWLMMNGIQIYPVVDGYTLTMTPLAAAQSGLSSAVSIMMGSVRSCA